MDCSKAGAQGEARRLLAEQPKHGQERSDFLGQRGLWLL